MSLPPYTTREAIAARLSMIFPEGTPNRGYCTRELAASTVFTMLYIGAVEGSGNYLGPVHVYRMTERQAAMADSVERTAYAIAVFEKNSGLLANAGTPTILENRSAMRHCGKD